MANLSLSGFGSALLASVLGSASCGPSPVSLVKDPPPTLYGLSAAPARAQIEGPCRALCSLGPSYAGSSIAAPAFTLRRETGETVRLEDVRGKVIVLNLWLSDAAAVVAPDLRALAKLERELRARTDVVLLSATSDPFPAHATALLASALPPDERFPVFFDNEGKTASTYATLRFPETYFIDKAGVIRARFDGTRAWGSAKALAFVDALSAGLFCPVDIDDGNVSGAGAEFCGARAP